MVEDEEGEERKEAITHTVAVEDGKLSRISFLRRLMCRGGRGRGW